MFAHGYRGSAAGTMGNAALRDMASDLGVALIAPKSGGEDWLIRNAPEKAFADDLGELGYFDALLDDALARFPIDAERILMSGFSAGGMVTWTLACHRGERFAAFLPIAGTFWAPIPEACASELVSLVHINGTADTIVPLEGRPIADAQQGNVRDAIALFATAAEYRPTEGMRAPPDLICDSRATLVGTPLALCLHDGGHEFRAPWVAHFYRTLVKAP
ncbi:MAG: polyhydroxybutyrate depolymerase [Pseudomonadota bacterium]